MESREINQIDIKPRNFGNLWNSFINKIEKMIFKSNYSLLIVYNELLKKYPNGHSLIQTEGKGLLNWATTFGHRVKREIGMTIGELKAVIIVKNIIKKHPNTDLKDIYKDVNIELRRNIFNDFGQLNKCFTHLYGKDIKAYQEELLN